MPDKIDVSLLVDNLKNKQMDYQKIFGLRLANGFKAKNDLVSLPIKDKVTLTREVLGNVTQPGRTGVINNPAHTVLQYKQRIGVLSPGKVDLYIDEVELYKLRVSFLANKQPADPSDINSIAGRDYIMGQVFKKTMSEANNAVFRGALGYGYDNTNAGTIATSAFQGGLNLVDGLGLKFTQGYATSGTGAIGDIPGANKVASAANNFTKATALAELGKLLEIVKAQASLEEFIYNDDPETPVYAFYLNAGFMAAIADALDELTYKNDQLIKASADGDGYEFKSFPNIKIRRRRWMQGVENIFGSSTDNVFYLHPDVEADIPSIKFQELGRGMQILMDFELGFDYADGRVVTLWK